MKPAPALGTTAVIALTLLMSGCAGSAPSGLAVMPSFTESIAQSPDPEPSATVIQMTTPSDLFKSYPSLPIPNGTAPSDAAASFVQVPGEKITFNMIGTLDYVPIDDDSVAPAGVNAESDSVTIDPLGAIAPDGEKLVAAQYSVAGTDDSTNHASLTVSLLVDGAQSAAKLPTKLSSGQTLVAAVPASATKVELQFLFDGVTQTLDMLTGQRTSTTAAAYYSGTLSDPTISPQTVSTDVNTPQGVYTMTAVVRNATRQAYTSNGWVDGGSGALINVQWELPNSGQIGNVNYSYLVQAISATLTDDAGTVYTIADAYDSQSVTVPATTTSLQLAFTVTGKFASSMGEQQNLDPVTTSPITIDFS